MLNLGARQGERAVSRPGRFTGEERVIMIVLTVMFADDGARGIE
jgi:hypothetical protein